MLIRVKGRTPRFVHRRSAPRRGQPPPTARTNRQAPQHTTTTHTVHKGHCEQGERKPEMRPCIHTPIPRVIRAARVNSTRLSIWHGSPVVPRQLSQPYPGSTSAPTRRPAPGPPPTASRSTPPPTRPHAGSGHPGQHARSASTDRNHRQATPQSET